MKDESLRSWKIVVRNRKPIKLSHLHALPVNSQSCLILELVDLRLTQLSCQNCIIKRFLINWRAKLIINNYLLATFIDFSMTWHMAQSKD